VQETLEPVHVPRPLTGSVRLTGEEATIEIRDGSFAVNLTGTSTRLALEGCRGSITAHLTGGTLTAEALRGSLQATVAADASVEVTRHEGSLTLAIRDDSSAEISEIDGPVKTSVMQSELRLAGATTLEMTASDARLTVARVRQITKFDDGDREYEIDLRDTEGREFDLGVVHHGAPRPCSWHRPVVSSCGRRPQRATGSMSRAVSSRCSTPVDGEAVTLGG
jgi:hypothetical protein